MTMPVFQFTALFVAALLANAVVKLWLALRQRSHVLAARHEVPQPFRGRIPLHAHQKAADYTVAQLHLALFSIAFDTALLYAYTLGGGIEWLSRWLGVLLADPLYHGVALIASVLLLSALLETPFSLYRTFVIEARFGFNKMTLRLYLLDALKGLALGALLGLPLLFAVLWLMNIMGEHWWLYVWVVWAGFNLLLLYLYPTFIAPLFNEFKPLADSLLKARIEALLARCGFASKGLFVMDGSKRSAHGNAYFTGFGRMKRIVFFDTLLEKLEGAEVEAVLAHELGHFKHRHVLKRIVWSFAFSLGLLWLLAQFLAAPWFYQGLGVSTPSAAHGLLLFLLVLPVFTFLLHPLAAAWSRKHEYEADAYAAEHSSAEALISALVKLYQDNAKTLTPDSLYAAFYESHPPALQRIAHLKAC